jgi:hypothetical protein
MCGVDTHLPLGRKGLSNMNHIYLKLPRNKYCMCCMEKFKCTGEWACMAECSCFCRDEDGFEHVVKICKCL